MDNLFITTVILFATIAAVFYIYLVIWAMRELRNKEPDEHENKNNWGI